MHGSTVRVVKIDASCVRHRKGLRKKGGGSYKPESSKNQSRNINVCGGKESAEGGEGKKVVSNAKSSVYKT